MTCEILVTREEGQALAGTITLVGGKLSYQAEPGFDQMMESILAERIPLLGGGYVERDKPDLWMRNLPRQYHGSYLRARLSEE
jgi:hypothetical protein